MAAIICPLCRLPIVCGDKVWRCDSGHCFDVAREGYVNLLPVQHKHSREPGDDVQMLMARRAFLQAGHYQPLCAAVLAQLAPLQARSLLDIGCGEGTYTGAFTAVAGEVIGLDIARPAIRMAAKRHPAITWLVGSNALLPLADHSIEVITAMFTQLQVDEMQRVLRPGGHVLVATPAADHLWSLRELLFEQVRAHQPDKFLTGFAAGFDLQAQQELRIEMQLQQHDLQGLLQMTPYAWKARPERRAALAQQGQLQTTAAFSLMLLKRR
jgi:23S rRNA (guanine745-N1)-methyltransferase